ncbi:hypothetical protein D9601_17715 [Sphingomonas sp. MA1305]|nr:hypothetical protein [Sphingomonas sp. MA1305]
MTLTRRDAFARIAVASLVPVDAALRAGRVAVWQDDVELAAVPPPTEGTQAILAAPGRAGLFVYRTGDHRAQIAADPRRGLSIAPHTAPDGAAGAWCRVVDGDLNLQWWGAAGDGVADDSDALAAAMAMVAFGPFTERFEAQRALYIPPGTYRLTRSGLLSNHVGEQRLSYRLYGAGEGSVLWLDPAAPGSDELWFYDNGTIPRGSGHSYANLCFAGGRDWRALPPSGRQGLYPNLSPRACGFRFSGPYYESGHVFTDCSFRYLWQSIHLAGSNNVDSIRFLACDWQACRGHFLLDNPQSFCVSLIDPYVSLGFGTFLEWGPGAQGAGAFSCYGGQIVMAEAAENGGAKSGDSLVVDARRGAPNSGNAPVLFSGTRFELYASSRLFDIAAGAGTLFTFRDCAILTTNTKPKIIGRLATNYCTVSIQDCSIYDQGLGGLDWVISCALGYGMEGKLAVLGSIMPADFLERVRFENKGGWLHVAGMRGAFAPAGGAPHIVLYDGDRFADGFAQHAGRTIAVKAARIDRGLAPDDRDGVVTQLPPGARLKSVMVRITGGSDAPYRVIVSDADRHRVFARSTPAPQNVGHFAESGTLLLRFDGPPETRRIRLWADDGKGGAPRRGSTDAVIEAWCEYY